MPKGVLRDPGVPKLRLDAGLVEESCEKGAIVDVVSAHRLDDARALGPFNAGRRRKVHVAHPTSRDEA